MTDTLPPFTSAELSDLKAKAKAATPGRWHRHRQGEITKGNYILANVNNPIRHGDKRDAAEFSNNLAHIAAANPETILRLIAMIERRDAWQPIETAPKDGTEVWVYTAPYDELPGFQSRCAYHTDAGWCTDDLRTVTHWQPLPAPPGEALAATESLNDKR